MPRFVITAFAVALLVALGSSPVLAHVTINPQEAAADSYARFAFRVGHGCEGSPTTEVAVQIPPGVVSVKPELVPGWEYETVVGELSEPVELHGEEITEGVQEVRWFGGPPIPDEAFQEFGLSVRLPDAAGDILYFPVAQRCGEGEHAWIERPDEGRPDEELEEPAPGLLLTAGGGHGGTVEEVTEVASASDGEVLASAVADAEQAASQARILAVLALVVALAAAGAAVVRARRN
ncbi:MAG TPA: YcnI family protein [Egibacteraceae bacterium]|jgi:periplasmic copper chaperone A|nr:YcnI family protein [Egibacteraceae bacterium]